MNTDEHRSVLLKSKILCDPARIFPAFLERPFWSAQACLRLFGTGATPRAERRQQAAALQRAQWTVSFGRGWAAVFICGFILCSLLPSKLTYDVPPETSVNRRSFLSAGIALGLQPSNAAAAPMPAFQQDEKSKLKVTGVRLVKTTPRRPPPEYKPAAGSWSTGGVEVANPMSIYPEYKPMRSLFQPDPGKLGGFTVEISTDKGVKGYGDGGIGGGQIVEQHLIKLLLNEDPFNVERLWDIMWRSTMYYGRTGPVIHAISGVDLALWDLAGNALGMPVYRLLGGETKPRIVSYCTGNDTEQHFKFGYTKLKLAIPHGPADGREGIKKNVALVKHTRDLLGPDGEIMLDCWMSWTERYTLEFAEQLEPYRVY